MQYNDSHNNDSIINGPSPRRASRLDQQLQVFVTVAEEKNFTRAAERMHMSQPAISQHIQSLERTLDAKLLDRTNKYVRLNKAGNIVYHHAKAILSQYSQMNRRIQELRNEASGTLSIGSSLSFGEYVLPYVIAGFIAVYPKVTPSITIENTQAVVSGVANGDLDIGIIEGTAHHDDVTVEPFATDRVVVVASVNDPLARLKQPTISDFSKQPWIIREKGSGTREITDRVFETYGIRPNSIMEFGSTQIIKESVEAGLGITLLSKWVIRKELQWLTLVDLPLSDTPIERQFSIVYRTSDFQTKAVELFRAFLKSTRV